MKTRCFLLGLFLIPAIIFARSYITASWQLPNLSLPDAYHVALGALGTGTNGFYCVEAAVDGNNGSWTFKFCTTNVPPQLEWVIVGFDGKTSIEFPKGIQ